MLRRILIALALIAFGSNAFALGGAQRVAMSPTVQFNLNVDSVRGQDTFGGLTRWAAKRNITALPALRRGQRLGLARGSQWRQQLTASAPSLKIAAYGTGARPILDASDVLLNAGFTKTAGFTNIYETAAINFIQGGIAAAWVNVFETGGPGDNPYGQFLQFVSSQALVDTTPGSYFISGLSVGGGVPTSAKIYIHTTDNSSPITNGYLYEFSNRFAGLYLTGGRSTVTGIEGRKASSNSGAITLDAGDGSAFVVDNCLLRGNNDHAVFTSSGSVVKNSIFINAYWGGQTANFLVFFDGTGIGGNFTSQNNIFQQDQNINAAGTVGIISHAGSGNNGTVFSTSDWHIAKNGADLSGYFVQNAASLTINGVNASQNSIFVSAYTNVAMTNSQYVSSFTFNRVIDVNVSSLSFTMSGNKFATTNGVSMFGLHGNTGLSFNVNGDIYYRNDNANSSDIFDSSAAAAASTLTINNATFDAAVAHMQPYDTTGGWTLSGGTTAPTANSYSTNVDRFTWNNAFVTSLAAYQALVSPQDSAAITSRSGSSANTLPTIPTVQ